MKFKDVLIFIAGICVGAGGMFLSTKKINDARVEKKVNEVINKMDKEAPKDDNEPVKEEPKEIIEEEPAEKQDEPADILRPSDEEIKATYAKATTDYSRAAISEPVTTMTDDIEQKAKEMIESAAKKPAKKGKAPKKITQEEFDMTPLEEQVQLDYYADNILADSQNVKYDPVEIMGATNLKSFKSNYETIYIRNFSTDLVYEVTYNNYTFAEIFGGKTNR